MVELNIKWGKESFVLEYDASTGFDGLTKQLEEKTNVPVDRMKLMAKSKGLWKGVLKSDTPVDWSGAASLGKIQCLLMGSASTLAKPKEAVVFLEDLPPEEIAKVAEPAGLANLGNTCYLNSVVQCLRAIPSFRQGIVSPPVSQQTQAQNVVHRLLLQALQKTLEQLDRQITPLQPMALVHATKSSFPQFATTGPHGHPQQQDAEEFYSALLTATAGETNSELQLKAALPNASSKEFTGVTNVADALFGIQMKETLTCDEVPDAALEPPVVSYDLHRKLICNIQGGGTASGSTTNVTHIQEGIQLALQGGMEKHSNCLGRNAAWTRTQRIARLPPVLTVQFGRFYWKATPESQDHAGVKCKIMKPVTFQPILDVYEFCTPEIQAVLGKARRAALAAEEDRVTKKLKGMTEEESAKEAVAAVPMETDDVAGNDDEEARVLQAALALSMATEEAETAQQQQDDDDPVVGPGLPKDFQGLYEMFAVVTHKGRDADGGHYMAWVKSSRQSSHISKISDTDQDNEDWFVFDDDEVSPCKTEDILKLKGGGDWHMSYLNFYRAKK